MPAPHGRDRARYAKARKPPENLEKHLRPAAPETEGFFLILLILAVSAARKANIAADIEQLEGGYQFVLAEGGTNLSGGQRQRIALARIFLKKPRILILDEATSALDNTSEKRIQAEIEKMKEECGTTVLSIAHRLSTLQNCDEIIVMDKGCIVQRGTYRELERAPGLFRDMALGIRK